MQTKQTKNKKATRETLIILIVDINSPCENNLAYIWFHVCRRDYRLFSLSRTRIIFVTYHLVEQRRDYPHLSYSHKFSDLHVPNVTVKMF